MLRSLVGSEMCIRDSFSSAQHQVIGPEFHYNASSSGYARFSPDGKYYAYYNQVEGLFLYDFDRSTGELSNLRALPLLTEENPSFATCEWSPNSRFLYLTKYDTLWQLDTWADPLDGGLEFIASRTVGNQPASPWFQQAALGPDCRIYIRGNSSFRTMHIIHKPDEQGQACDFQEQGLVLPHISSTGSFPNFPRFRVDEEEKCDPSISCLLYTSPSPRDS